jgi:ribosome-associated protein
MTDHNLNKPLVNRPFGREYKFITARSAGPGGQHVNKTETKVELRFHVENSRLLSDEEKEIILKSLKRRITDEGYLQVFAQEHRSQAQNRELAEKRFYKYLTAALKKKKKRVPTKPSKKAIEKRIHAKKKKSEIKATRARISLKDK